MIADRGFWDLWVSESPNPPTQNHGHMRVDLRKPRNSSREEFRMRPIAGSSFEIEKSWRINPNTRSLYFMGTELIGSWTIYDLCYFIISLYGGKFFEPRKLHSEFPSLISCGSCPMESSQCWNPFPATVYLFDLTGMPVYFSPSEESPSTFLLNS